MRWRHAVSLPALLDECPDELFRVLFQHLVDLVQDCIDVFAQRLVPFGDLER